MRSQSRTSSLAKIRPFLFLLSRLECLFKFIGAKDSLETMRGVFQYFLRYLVTQTSFQAQGIFVKVSCSCILYALILYKYPPPHCIENNPPPLGIQVDLTSKDPGYEQFCFTIFYYIHYNNTVLTIYTIIIQCLLYTL